MCPPETQRWRKTDSHSVNERDGEVSNPMHTSMVVNGGNTGNIEQANPTRASQAFLVVRMWQCDGPSHGLFPRTIIGGFSTSWSSEAHMMVNRGRIPATKSSQVNR
jgi:hypothetical protein